MKARARCELKQLFGQNERRKWTFRILLPEKKKKKKGKARWSYDKMLIDWVRSGRTGKYLALGHGARTSLRSVRTPWPRAKYFPVRPSHSVNKYILSYDPYGPARAFIAKLLRKSPYEGRTRWREQGRKKPSCPARIAYGPHTGIFSIVLQWKRARDAN